jgi:hypothetical protein
VSKCDEEPVAVSQDSASLFFEAISRNSRNLPVKGLYYRTGSEYRIN